MSIRSFFSSLLAQPEEATINPHLEVRKEDFFLNEEKHQYYLTHRWCAIENVVKPEEIKSFMDTFTEISKLEGFELDKNL